jgi:hypothetical protein
LGFKFFVFFTIPLIFHSRRWFIFYFFGFPNFFFEVGVWWETTPGPSSLPSPHEEPHPCPYKK